MRIALLIQYDGTSYHGWQIQMDQTTVQGLIEAALEKLYGSKISILGSGRTDSGVHALGQVAHFDVDHTAVPAANIWMALNQMLPDEIRIVASTEVHADFHSRFDARERTYQYRMSTRQNVLTRDTRWYVRYPIDADSLKALGTSILGSHNFSSFCYAGTETVNMQCDIQTADWHEELDGGLMFQIQGDRFLHHMVRMLVGSMIEVARGKWEPEYFQKLLDHPDRKAQVVTAPAKGLALMRVAYPEHMQPKWDQAEMTIAGIPVSN